jgi:hypothetical protein
MELSLSRTNRFAVLVYLCALSLPWIADYLAPFLNIPPYDPRDHWYFAIMKPEFWYEKVTSIGSNQETDISVVTIREGIEPNEALGVNRCNARSFLAKLLVKINEASPRVIVIDRWYGRIGTNICPQGDDGTKELARTITEISKSTPIVIALDSVSRHDVSPYCHSPVVLSETSVILPEREHFEEGNPNVHYGLAQLDDEEENRRIPLGWIAYEDCKQAAEQKNWKLVPTLALESVSVALHKDISELLEKDKLDADYKRIRPPFAHFRENGFPQSSALEVLCGKCSSSDWKTYSSQQMRVADSNKLDPHKIVIVGELREGDAWPTVLGQMPGAILQANYIESLMESRFFRPVLSGFQFAVSLCWFVIIELIFRWKASSPNLALLLCFAAALVLAFFCYLVLIVYFSFYIVLSIPSLLAMFGRWASLRLEKVYEQKQKNNAPVPDPAD